MKANMISHIACFSCFAVSPPSGPLGPDRKVRKTSYVRNHLSFHLRPVLSKNIENWRSFSILSVEIFEKKYFLDFGKFPISTPDF